jgi:predicted metal-dependent hydrolase
MNSHLFPHKYSLLGVQKNVRCVITVLQQPFVSDTTESILFHNPLQNSTLPKSAALFALLRNFYRLKAEKFILQRSQYWIQQMQLQPQKIRFKETVSRWGSCSSKGSINFNWHLIVYPADVIDYVIVHELAHLRFMNHSKDFWGLVRSHLPDYKLQRQYLRQNYDLSHFLLHWKANKVPVNPILQPMMTSLR